jgi:hypothetical protein
VVELDPDAVLWALEQRYRASLSQAVEAKSRYLSLKDDAAAAASARRRAFADWQEQDARCRILAHRLQVLRRRIDG